MTLYQTQRSILRQRTAEKDTYIYQLAHERIEMQNKLGELQALVMQLLGDRRMLHSYHSMNHALQNTSTVSSDYATPLKHNHTKRRKHNVDAANGTQPEGTSCFHLLLVWIGAGTVVTKIGIQIMMHQVVPLYENIGVT